MRAMTRGRAPGTRGFRGTRLRRVPRLGLVAVAALALGACDDDPSGPGTFTARVVSPADRPAGAVIVEITGEGIEGFEALGSSRIFTRTVRPPTDEDREGRYRVVAVAPSGSELRFAVKVQDVATGFPASALVSLADTANARIEDTSDHRIRWER